MAPYDFLFVPMICLSVQRCQKNFLLSGGKRSEVKEHSAKIVAQLGRCSCGDSRPRAQSSHARQCFRHKCRRSVPGKIPAPVQKLSERRAPMTIPGLLFGTQFGKGLFDLREIKQRIVSETI